MGVGCATFFQRNLFLTLSVLMVTPMAEIHLFLSRDTMIPSFLLLLNIL